MAIPELPEEDWDQELVFPAHLIDWEHAVSQAAAMGENEADVVGDDQVKTLGGEANVIVKEDKEVGTPGEGATARALAETDGVVDDQVEVQVEEMDVIVEEVEELEVPNKETAEATDVVWDLKNTSPKVIDEDLDMTWALTAASMSDNENMPDFEGMPDLEDGSSKEPTGEEPQVDNPPAEGPQPCLGSASKPKYVKTRSSSGLQSSHGFDTCMSTGKRVGGTMHNASTPTTIEMPKSA